MRRNYLNDQYFGVVSLFKAESVYCAIMSFLIAFSLVSCTPPSTIPDSGYEPASGGKYVVASWYGEKFHGRPTSSGERYDMQGLTAAHKTMKFGTRLRVTNPETSESVVVIVNDRGPFIAGRDLDLSYGAAKAISHVQKGVGRVYIEDLGRDMSYVKRKSFLPTDAAPGTMPVSYAVQLGAFADEANAVRLKTGLMLGYENVHIAEAMVNGSRVFRVRIGRFSSYDDALRTAQRLMDEGYDIFITSK
ncbi:MAG: septal ring lytic transglycosylase RlpA family protein [Nitrospira sp.]|nr:septal ring lytic transglycosylase RlpA family protein [bacterium]MBL7049670.1 septal ring lytic transglycosylase RlpA family protein [Nitrospira sp.]